MGERRALDAIWQWLPCPQLECVEPRQLGIVGEIGGEQPALQIVHAQAATDPPVAARATARAAIDQPDVVTRPLRVDPKALGRLMGTDAVTASALLVPGGDGERLDSPDRRLHSEAPSGESSLDRAGDTGLGACDAAGAGV